MTAGLRATATSTTGGSPTSNQSIVIPTSGSGGTVVAGDVAVLEVQYSSSSGVLTALADWNLRSGPDGTSNRNWVYTRTLTASDPGRTVTLTFTGGAAGGAHQMSVYHDVTETGLLIAGAADTTSDTSTTLPSLASVPSGSVVHIALHHRYGGTSAPDFTVGSPYSQGVNSRAATSYAGSPNISTETAYRVVSSAGTYGGETVPLNTASPNAPASVGWNYVLALPPAAPPPPPVAAGANQTGIEPGSTVTLTGSDSFPATGVTRTWSQVDSNPPVTLTPVTSKQVTFVAPLAATAVTYTFQYTVTDTAGGPYSATVTVAVLPPAEFVMVGGVWTPALVSILSNTNPVDTSGGGSTGGGGDTGGGGTVPQGLSITATPEPGYNPPRIRLDIADTRTTPIGSLTIYRQNPDGHKYPVRTTDAGPLPLSGGQATLFDYEAPFDSPITYTTDQAGGPVVATELFVSRPWLVHPGVPSRSFCPYRMGPGTHQEETWDVDQGSFTVLGRDTPIIATGGARQAPASTLNILVRDAGELAALRLVLSDASPLLLSVPADMGWGLSTAYIAVGKVTASRISPRLQHGYRMVSLPYQVVARPAGGTQATINWNTVVAQYATWQDVVNAVSTWADLTSPRA